MLLAVLLLVAPCASAQTQMDLDECWSAQAKQADAALNKTYGNVVAGLKAQGASTKPLLNAQLAWITARDKTCEFEYALVQGGSIAPQVSSMCVDRMTRARTARLQAWYDTLQAGDDIARASPVSPQVDAELNRVYKALNKQLNADQQAQLVAAETAWLAYRDAACSFAGNQCLTQLEKERTQELKDGWLGEPFW
ncbi:MAG: DUF1311 domain-containing protein [Candidatus Eremiobacteraeota bacterium]|nr:DUF1311 domain-containing protein [Candidatus Eremiobacteraeota bacterium]